MVIQMSKGYKTLKEIELDLVVKSGLIQQLKLKVEELEQKLKNCHEFYLEQLKEKQEKINKAIEYLNDECLYDKNFGFCDDLYCGQVQELVNILKGVDKE